MDWGIYQVALTSLFAGLAAGWMLHRADFCAVAALRDIYLFKDSSMFRAQLLLVSISVILFHALGFSKIQDYPATPFFGLPSLGNIVGGVLFGFGMVLAGGCVVGVLYRLGSGSRLALTAFFGLIAGSAVYAEIHSWWVSLASFMRISETPTLPLLTGIPTPFWMLAMLFLAVSLWRSFARQKFPGESFVRGHLEPHQAAIGLSLCGLFSLLLVGMPLGVTTSYAKIAAIIENVFVPAHVASLDFFSQQPLSYSPPFSSLEIAGGGGPMLDAIALIQFPLIAGILLGAFFSAWRTRELRGRYKPPVLQVLVAFTGGMLMGIASRLTPGCNVWHVWGGLPHLALSSILFFMALFPGAWVGTLVIKRVILHSQQEISA